MAAIVGEMYMVSATFVKDGKQLFGFERVVVGNRSRALRVFMDAHQINAQDIVKANVVPCENMFVRVDVQAFEDMDW